MFLDYIPCHFNHLFCLVNRSSMIENVGILFRPKKSFTWKFVNYNNIPAFGVGKTRQMIKESFEDWIKYAPLTFREVSANANADINMAFVDRYHPEGHYFQRLGILAYALGPYHGVIRFNADVKWTDK